MVSTTNAGASSSAAAGAAASSDAARKSVEEKVAQRPKKCPVVLVVGMAGSGKTTLVDAFSAWLEDEDEDSQNEGDTAGESVANTASEPNVGATSGASPLPGDGCYVVNLDPAVTALPYEPNVDVRDTISYKNVMKEYALGPNGGILTSLNLYATRFDQVLELVETRAATHRAVVVDTPGQIETFTWSASGGIITDALAQSLATVVLFVLDVPRALNAMTFVSSMLYACSIMYKTRLPMVVVLNKCDAGDGKKVEEWMRDYDAFDSAMQEHSMAGVLANSIAMGLEEFYKVVDTVHVSAIDGSGMDELATAIEKAVGVYEAEYRPWVEERRRIAREVEDKRRENEMGRLKDDLKMERMNSFHPVDDEMLKELEEKERKEKEDREARENADPEEKEAFDNLMKYANAMTLDEEKGE